eukprot:1161992-Pelagomonas_calceolata.AAC.7
MGQGKVRFRGWAYASEWECSNQKQCPATWACAPAHTAGGLSCARMPAGGIGCAVSFFTLMARLCTRKERACHQLALTINLCQKCGSPLVSEPQKGLDLGSLLTLDDQKCQRWKNAVQGDTRDEMHSIPFALLVPFIEAQSAYTPSLVLLR